MLVLEIAGGIILAVSLLAALGAWGEKIVLDPRKPKK